MALNIGKEIAALKRMTVKQLRARHIKAFGEATRSGHREYLVKRIAWRLQAQGNGDLSERAPLPCVKTDNGRWPGLTLLSLGCLCRWPATSSRNSGKHSPWPIVY